MEPIEFILVANGPGELSSLVKPLVEKIKEHSTKTRPVRTTLILTPCQFSSGREMDFIKTLKTDQLVRPEDYRKWILGISTVNELKLKSRGVVLYLGGDMLHPVLISKKLGYKVYAYIHGQRAAWGSIFSKFFVIDEKIKKKLIKERIPKEKIIPVGDLMINSVNPLSKEEVLKTWHLKPDRLIVAFLPGSRDWEINYMLPFYEKAAEELRKLISGIQFQLIVSPFTPLEEIESKIKPDSFDMLAPINTVSAADLAVTIPGTNTAQIAAMGIPTLMLFPLNKVDNIPLEGLLHYVAKIPLLGKSIKKIAAKVINSKTKFFALPNIRAQKMILPELRGNISPVQAVEKIIELLKQPENLKQMGIKLKKVMGEGNAAELIIREILNDFNA